MLPEEDARLLKHHTYDAYQALVSPTTAAGGSVGNDSDLPGDLLGDLLIEGAVRQAEVLKPAIESCIARAAREGIGLVLEGSHFLPGVLDPGSLSGALLCILDVPDREALKQRVLSPNHSRRRLSEDQLGRLVQLQNGILGLAQLHHQPVVINDNLSRAVKQIRDLVGR